MQLHTTGMSAGRKNPPSEGDESPLSQIGRKLRPLPPCRRPWILLKLFLDDDSRHILSLLLCLCFMYHV